MPETRKLTFSIAGRFITDTAREYFYQSNNLEKAVDLIMHSTMTDLITPEERFITALKIIDGMADIVGVYPHDDYDVQYHETRNPDVKGLYNHLSETAETINALETEKRQLEEKISLILSELPAETIDRLNRLCYNELGTRLCDGYDPDDDLSMPNTSLLDSFLQQTRADFERGRSDDNYGWLEPNGTFHIVDWGEHQNWAYEWLKEHRPEDCPKINIGKSGDILFSYGWILLHSPGMGIAEATRNHEKRITKKQRDFLYGYYMDRNCPGEAAIYMED